METLRNHLNFFRFSRSRVVQSRPNSNMAHSSTQQVRKYAEAPGASAHRGASSGLSRANGFCGPEGSSRERNRGFGYSGEGWSRPDGGTPRIGGKSRRGRERSDSHKPAFRPPPHPTGITPVRLKIHALPLSLWRWGGITAIAGAIAASFAGLLAIFAISQTLWRQTPSLGLAFLCWLGPSLPFLFSFQHTEFDNDELIVKITYWMLLPLQRISIPYQGIKGIGTDYRILRMTPHFLPRPQNPYFDLFIYTRSRRCYFLSRHYTERDFQRAVDEIRDHVRFPILRFE